MKEKIKVLINALTEQKERKEKEIIIINNEIDRLLMGEDKNGN